MKSIVLFCTLSISSSILALDKPEKKPNFVWFMEEDVSKHYLSLYNQNGQGAVTPNVEKLAQEGLLFNHAFCNAPVSSAARSTLFTGCYAPRTGMSWHRKLQVVPMPDGLELFPAYLKKAGYYTSNSSKTDYNCVLQEDVWDSVKGNLGEWRNRPQKEMPFFFVRTNATSHESCLHFPLSDMTGKPTDYAPDGVVLPSIHPDTELFRYTYSTFYDRISKTDKELGTLMQMLSDDNLLDDTFIFYFGDNGGSLPGSKGYTGELGLHVPLVVYVPKNWRDKLNLPIGKSVDGFVSFLDFAPTLLHLAGIDIPEQMDGTPFLGEDISWDMLNKRDKTFGYGDRFDELYAFTRTVRIGKYKYSRNFVPYQPKGFYAFYRYKMEAFKEWKALYDKGGLTAAQRSFFEPQEPEELFDVENDPYETHNLAKDIRYEQTLKMLRHELKNNMLSFNDLGLMPETVWLKEGIDNPVRYGEKNKKRLENYSDILDLELGSFEEAKSKLQKALRSEDPVTNYWALTVCIYWGEKSKCLKNEVTPLLSAQSSIVRSRAVLSLSAMGERKLENRMSEVLYSSQTEAEMLQILGDIVFMKDYLHIDFKIDNNRITFPIENNLWRIEYINMRM